jgi:signal transduction histidine kinase
MKYLLFVLIISYIPSIKTHSQDLNIVEKQKLADEAFAANNFEKASENYLYVFQNSNEETEEKGKIAYKIAISKNYLGESEEAINWFNVSADILFKLKKLDNYYIAKGRLAGVYDDIGNYNAAIEIGEEIVNYFQKQIDSLYAGKTLHNLALYYYHNGNTDKAIETYSEAITWIADLDDKSKSKSLNMLGNIWAVDLANEKKALSYYKQSLALKLKNATPQSISASYNNIGISHKNLGDYDSALYNYKIAYDYALESKIPNAVFNPLVNLANLYKRLGQMDKAIAYYNKVLDIDEYLNVRQQLDIRLNLGMAYNDGNEFNKALNQLKIAEKFAIENDNLKDHSTIMAQIGVANNGLKKFEEAYQSQLTYNSLKDSLLAKEKAQEIADQMIKYESAQKDLQLLEQKQAIQQQELKSQRQSIWFIIIVGIVLLVAGILFYLFKRKAAIAKQASLELSLAEQKEVSRIQAERLRISRELHDNIGSYLTLMSASIEQLSMQNGTDSKEGENPLKIHGLQDTISMSMRELRKTVWLLNKQSVSIDEIALRIRDFFKPLHQNGTHISVKTEGNTEEKINEIQTTQLFRVIQEAVNNAYKYSKSNEIEIKLVVTADKTLSFSISDDGEGFSLEQSNSGNGLQNIKSRIAELKGEVQIESKIGNGTQIAGSFPMENTKNFV